MKEENNILDKVNSWIKNSVTLKLASIAILILLLLIPSSMVKSIITERELLNREAISEVSTKWANSQEINGPILTIPVHYAYMNNEKLVESTRYWHILPEDLEIKGKVMPETLSRGIYKIVVYKSDLSISGKFLLDKSPEKSNLKEIKWDEAFLTIGISDLRGIEEQVVLNWGTDKLDVEPGSRIPSIISTGITIDLPLIDPTLKGGIPYNLKVKLQGSRNMSFIPVGNTTTVHLTSDWKDPSFNGNFLPDLRKVNDEGFIAQWKVLQLNRNFPQAWMNSELNEDLENASFGVNLILPLDDYQKAMRSAKYAVMTIALTFLVFFLVEILNGRKIHPFQYTLVGLALTTFYILLISISEHSNFNLAYSISMGAIVSMITLYSFSIFKTKKQSILLFFTLSGIYGFLFVTLQLADYALLLGSAGLTLILGLTMYFTRKINWYNLKRNND